jgi:hypothetical protein
LNRPPSIAAPTPFRRDKRPFRREEAVKDFVRPKPNDLHPTAMTSRFVESLDWFRNEPIADCDHKTAAELVADGRLEAVLSLSKLCT